MSRRFALDFTATIGLALALSATGAEAQVAAPAPRQIPTPRAPMPGSGQVAPNLGITYQFVPYGRAFGARLTAAPTYGSPAASIGLEPGDLIYALDNQYLRAPADLLAHVGPTTIDFVNVRTGRPQRNVVYVPPQPGPGPLPPPGPTPPGPFPPGPPPPTPSPTLGVRAVPVALDDIPGPYRARPEYAPPSKRRPNAMRIVQVEPGSAAQRSGLEVGDSIVTINNVAIDSDSALRSAIAGSGGRLLLTIKNVRPPYNYESVTINLGRPYYGPGPVR